MLCIEPADQILCERASLGREHTHQIEAIVVLENTQHGCRANTSLGADYDVVGVVCTCFCCHIVARAAFKEFIAGRVNGSACM